MTEHLCESDSLYNNIDRGKILQHSPTVMSLSYGAPNMISVQPSPVSPHFIQEPLASPVTPRNDLSPMIEVPKSGGPWDTNQFGKTASDPWGCSQEDFGDCRSRTQLKVHSNTEQATKFNGSSPQRLDSFYKAFPAQNFHIIYGNSNGRDTNCTEENQISGMPLPPQGGILPDGPDWQAFSHPSQLVNQMAMHSQAQHIESQRRYQPLDTQHAIHNLHQNHQQYHYGFQQQHQEPVKVGQIEQMQQSFQKQESQYYIHQQGFQVPQSPSAANHPILNQQQQHIAPEHHRGLYFQQTPRESQDDHQPLQSPSYYHTQQPQTPELQPFQVGPSLSMQSPQCQEQQHFRPLPHQSNLCMQQQQTHTQEQAHSIQSKHHIQDSDGHLLYHDKKTPASVQGFSGPKQDSFGSLKMNIEGRPVGNTKLKCTVCQREFKSLPALNGHMRSHGGFRMQLSAPKMKDGHIQLPVNPIVLPVSVPIKHYPPSSKHYVSPQCPKLESDLNVFAESYPQPSQSPRDQTPSITVTEGAQVAPSENKRSRRCLVPLVIPPFNNGQPTRGAVLFQSQLRSPGSVGENEIYTPPPMLSPIRPGSGLFSGINVGLQSTGSKLVQRVLLCKESSIDSKVVTPGPGEQTVDVKPQINIGADFQAVIPDMRSRPKAEEESHKASLVWSSCIDLSGPDNQRKVEDLMKMACSSVLPGGGTNIEYVLHCLFKCKGDIMATLEKLLLRPFINVSNPLLDYHYAGSDKWTLQEKRQLNKALMIHHKDFHLIQKMVKTKTVAQCVEYYYTWKKRLRLGRRLSIGQITPGEEREGEWEEGKRVNIEMGKDSSCTTQLTELMDNISAASVCESLTSGPVFNGKAWTQTSPGLLSNLSADPKPVPFGSGSLKSSPSNSTTSGDTDSTPIFPCTECGKTFFKVKSRNAHMKSHRQQEEASCWQSHRPPEQMNLFTTPESPHDTLLSSPTTIHPLVCNNTEGGKRLPVTNGGSLSTDTLLNARSNLQSDLENHMPI
ncbi:transcriptional-regulating factor 1 [Chanos chanos]|uniref:Transcriptional-regulating factor 1 n=1 Tax=Chanos chanos TaxID=29144 RepID=A0A6J2W2R6_CHACN|nr:transcriptional-regulating factor 1-like [Chanos chanos]